MLFDGQADKPAQFILKCVIWGSMPRVSLGQREIPVVLDSSSLAENEVFPLQLSPYTDVPILRPLSRDLQGSGTVTTGCAQQWVKWWVPGPTTAPARILTKPGFFPTSNLILLPCPLPSPHQAHPALGDGKPQRQSLLFWVRQGLL